MTTWKNILTGYLNNSKKGNGQYLTITNVSDEEITIKPGDKIFLNKTPDQVLQNNPKVPAFSKSIKLGEDQPQAMQEAIDQDTIPF